MSADSSAAMRAALLAGGTVIAAWVRAGAPPTRLAPIISVFERQRREIFVLGRRQDDLAFHLRRRSDKLRFHTPSSVLPHALAKGGVIGDTLNVSAIAERGSVTLEVAGRDARIRRRVGLGVGDAWRLFLPDDAFFGRYEELWTLVTMIALWLPLGYWGARVGMTWTATAAAVVAAVVGSLAIIPWMAAAPPAPLAIWFEALAAIAFGWAASHWIQSEPSPPPADSR